jgi:hypothetical protein
MTNEELRNTIIHRIEFYESEIARQLKEIANDHRYSDIAAGGILLNLGRIRAFNEIMFVLGD